jgi:GTPase SAR1 family protein
MRPLSYPNTNVFLITFSFTDPASFANVSKYILIFFFFALSSFVHYFSQWIKELTHHSSTPTPFFLIGLKYDGERKVSEDEVKALLAKTDKIEETFYVSCKQDKGRDLTNKRRIQFLFHLGAKELFTAICKAAVKHSKGSSGGGSGNDAPVVNPKRMNMKIGKGGVKRRKRGGRE